MLRNPDANQCPNDLFHIWSGGDLRKSHQLILRSERRLNPDYKIDLWVDRKIISKEAYNNIKAYVNKYNIQLSDIRKDFVPADEDKELYQFICDYHEGRYGGIINFGFTSDVLRALRLKQLGGIYTDLDVVPKKSLSLNISLPLGFRYYFQANLFNLIVNQSPCVLMSMANSFFICKTVEVMRKLILDNTQLTASLLSCVSSDNANIRKLATSRTSGSAFEIALKHMLYEGAPCFEYYNYPIPGAYVQSGLYEKITAPADGVYYSITYDRSYLYDEYKRMLPGIKKEAASNSLQREFDYVIQQTKKMYFNYPDTVFVEMPIKKNNKCCSLWLRSVFGMFAQHNQIVDDQKNEVSVTVSEKKGV